MSLVLEMPEKHGCKLSLILISHFGLQCKSYFLLGDKTLASQGNELYLPFKAYFDAKN